MKPDTHLGENTRQAEVLDDNHKSLVQAMCQLDQSVPYPTHFDLVSHGGKSLGKLPKVDFGKKWHM